MFDQAFKDMLLQYHVDTAKEKAQELLEQFDVKITWEDEYFGYYVVPPEMLELMEDKPKKDIGARVLYDIRIYYDDPYVPVVIDILD